MTDKQLEARIIESMKGIILDHEARKDKDIVDFYADVFVMICKDYAEGQLVVNTINKKNKMLFCGGCGNKKQLNTVTDINSGRSCKNKLCKQNNLTTKTYLP